MKKLKIQVIILLALLTLSTSFLAAEQKYIHKREKYLKVRIAELATDPHKFNGKNIYFIIDNIYATWHCRTWHCWYENSLLGKRYLSFRLYKENSYILLWVDKRQKNDLDLLYDLAGDSNTRLVVFAKVKRKRRSPSDRFHYFVIVRDCAKIN